MPKSITDFEHWLLDYGDRIYTEVRINSAAASEAVRHSLRQFAEVTLHGEVMAEPMPNLHGVSDAMSGFAHSVAESVSLFGVWIQDLNSARENLDDDYKLKDESEYQSTDPISFEELMDFGGEAK